MGVKGVLFLALTLGLERTQLLFFDTSTNKSKKQQYFKNLQQHNKLYTHLLMMIATKMICAGFKNLILLNLCIKK